MRINSEGNIGNQGASRDGRKARAHDLVTFGPRKILNERLDKNGTFALSDERGCCGANCFCTRHFHRPEEEFGEFHDDPLQYSPIIQQLNASNKEDDGRDNGDKKPAYINSASGKQLPMVGIFAAVKNAVPAFANPSNSLL